MQLRRIATLAILLAFTAYVSVTAAQSSGGAASSTEQIRVVNQAL
jgi:hypothetical protein